MRLKPADFSDGVGFFNLYSARGKTFPELVSSGDAREQARNMHILRHSGQFRSTALSRRLKYTCRFVG